MTHQIPLALPATNPAFDITPLLTQLDTLPMSCPYCGTLRVVLISTVVFGEDRTETWLCYVCNDEFDGWDEIPHPHYLRV